LLKLYGVEFEEYDVSRPEHLREFATRLPRARSIPQIFINGNHIGNDEDLRILADKGGLDDV
jgi:glutaredoxin 3